jgi:hypothetical protein
MIARTVGAALVLGTVLNIVGWVGNALVLRDMWEAAAQAAPAPALPVEPRWLKDLLSLVSDYVFATVLCFTYSIAAPGWRGSMTSLAFVLSFLVWLAGVPMTYLAFVAAGYLPVSVSVATSLWALATFLLFAPALPYLLPQRSHA